MASSKEDKVALSYYDSLLRESDVTLLGGVHWINDKVIGFYFEYLEHEVFSGCSGRVCFITPDVTQFIKLYKGPELSMFLEPLCLDSKDLVLLAVNNNASTEKSGGTHWSLLVYSRSDNTFHSLDSCGSMNVVPSRQCAEKIAPFLKSYDCGVFVLMFAEAMCSMYLRGCPSETTLYSLKSEDCDQFRTKCLQLIRTLQSAEGTAWNAVLCSTMDTAGLINATRVHTTRD